MKKFIYKNSVALSLLWAAIIFLLCATPGQYIPSSDWLELLSFDKFVHASMFLVLLSLLFITAIRLGQSKIWLVVYFFIGVIYGSSLELMQAYVFSNRSADWKDMVANTFGCVVALLFLKRIRKLITTI